MNSSKISLLLIAAACLCPGAGAAGDPVVTVGKTVEISRSHGHCWFPTIHRFGSGEIMVTMSMCPDEADYASDFSGYCISRDGGLTWDERHPLGMGAIQDGAWSEAPDANGDIWHAACYLEPVQPGQSTRFYAAMTQYSHGGSTTTEDRDVVLTLNHPVYMGKTGLFEYFHDGKFAVPDTKLLSYPIGMTWGTMFSGPNGEWFSCAYYLADEDTQGAGANLVQGSGPYREVLLRSTDGGKNWSEYSTIAAVPIGARPAWMGTEGPCEGSVAVLGGGRLYAIYRTGGKGGIGNSWSSDWGKTWTAPAPIGFQGVAPRVHRLSNGMLVLVTGRPGPVVLRLNPDGEGKHWTAPTTLFTEMSTRYTDVLEVSPGHLLAVYDSVPYGWYDIPFADRDNRNKVLGTFVDVAQK